MSDLRDRLYVLFGGGGFLGRYVAQALMRTGARIRVAQRDPRQAFAIKSLGSLGQSQFVAADITRPETVARAVAGADGVLNLVGAFGGDLDAIHVAGARHVAEAARAAGAGALVHVSAIGADPGAASRYGRTKGEGEAAVRDAFPGATVLRPSVVFAPEDQFLNRFAQLIKRLPVVPVVAPATRFQPVYAGDVADAVAAALRHPERFGGHMFELGGPDLLSMLAIQHFIADEIGRSPTFLPLPNAAGGLLASLPGGPLSRDQWLMLQRDSVVGEGAGTLADLGVEATPMAAVAPAFLTRFRRAGRFGRRAAESF
jgi:uncharacterized protein YbjT (DUF2867 family)